MLSVYRNILLLFLLGITLNSHGQNLVPNGSFEDLDDCPDDLGQLERAKGWHNPSLASPDIFNICDDSAVGVPQNWQGTQPPQDGNGYAGIISKTGNNQNYREYLQIQLKSKLEQGKSYYFEMYVSKGDVNIMLDKKLSILFTDSLTFQPNSEFIDAIPQIVTNTYFVDKDGWTKFSTVYVAKGFENVITIGNFTTITPGVVQPGDIPEDENIGGNDQCYYYIDNIFLGDCPLGNLKPNFLGRDTIICGTGNFELKLDASMSINTLNYFWNTGSDDSSIIVTKPGTYHVTISSQSCKYRDTIVVKQNPYPKLNLGPDPVVCEGTPVTFSVLNANASRYHWFDEGNRYINTVNESGWVWVDMTVKGCTTRDSALITYLPKPRFSLGKDLLVCDKPYAQLTPVDLPSNSHYTWSTHDTTSAVNVLTSGTYWLQTERSGCKFTDTINVFISRLNQFNLGKDTSICSSTPITLNATQSHASKYLWNTGFNLPSIKTKESGWYWVVAMDSACFKTDSIFVNVVPAPSVHLGSDTNICSNSNFILDAGNDGSTYLWNNGTTTQTRPVTGSGKYQVRVTKNNCTVADSIIIDVSNPPALNLGEDTILCKGTNLRLNAYSTGSTYRWSNGSVQPTYDVSQNGIYYVIVRNNACILKDSINVLFITKPTIDLGNDTATCLNNPITIGSTLPDKLHLEWQDGSNQKLFTTNKPGKYWVTANYGGCYNADTIYIIQLPKPIINLGGDRQVCKNEKIELDDSNPNAPVKWSTNETTQKITVYAPGLFIARVDGNNGCISIDSIFLDTLPSPVLNLGKDTNVCNGKNLVLNAGSEFTSYVWNNGSTGNFMEVLNSGIYWVKIKDHNNCNLYDTIAIGMFQSPVLNMTDYYEACEPTFTIEAPSNFASYLWSDGSTAPSYLVTKYGTITLTVSDFHSCSTKKDIEIVNTCSPIVFVPNAFTPNNDGVNDKLTPSILNVNTFEFQVYNRWGQIVFSTTELQSGWDGNYRNETAASDVYFYKLSYKGFDNITQVKQGNITLLK